MDATGNDHTLSWAKFSKGMRGFKAFPLNLSCNECRNFKACDLLENVKCQKNTMFNQSQKRHLFHDVMMAFPKLEAGRAESGEVKKGNFSVLGLGHFESELMG